MRVSYLNRRSPETVGRLIPSSLILFRHKWGGRWGSNPRPPESQSGALPTELRPPQIPTTTQTKADGAPDRNRTCNPQLRRLVLYPVELRAQQEGLSHHNGRGGEIRTPDILLPKQARYQAALHPDRRAETISPQALNVNPLTVILPPKLL